MRKSILLALASAFSHIESASTAVQFSFAKRAASTHNTATGLARRAPDAGFSYQAAVYVVNVTVGTPGQPLSLQISSSASNTWVVDARSSWCTSETYDYDTDEYIKSSGLCPWGACKFNWEELPISQSLNRHWALLQVPCRSSEVGHEASYVIRLTIFGRLARKLDQLQIPVLE